MNQADKKAMEEACAAQYPHGFPFDTTRFCAGAQWGIKYARDLQQGNIFMDGDVNEGYESRVKASTGKNTLIPKDELAALKAENKELGRMYANASALARDLQTQTIQLIEALKVIKEEAEYEDYRGLRTYKLCTDLLAKYGTKKTS